MRKFRHHSGIRRGGGGLLSAGRASRVIDCPTARRRGRPGRRRTASVPARPIRKRESHMLGSPLSTRPARRGGAAAVEMALLLPLLAFLCVISVDFARIFYY